MPWRNCATETQLARANKRRTRMLNQISIWLRKAAVFGGIDEANAMVGVGEKGRTGAHAGEMTTFAFDAQILLKATLCCHQAYQRFRLMGVKLISDKDPRSLRVGLDGLGDVSSKVGFGARGSNAGSNDLSSGHVKIGDQTLGAMAAVFEFFSFDVTGLQRQRGVKPLEGLDAGHLIGTRHMRARRSECRGRLIHLTHGADLLGQVGGVVGWGSEPVALAMRL
jgi:hypothetical protein